MLVSKDILGGAFRKTNGQYFVALNDLSKLDLVRHELQHVIDDADNHDIYTPTSVKVQLQSSRVSQKEIYNIYCKSNS